MQAGNALKENMYARAQQRKSSSPIQLSDMNSAAAQEESEVLTMRTWVRYWWELCCSRSHYGTTVNHNAMATVVRRRPLYHTENRVKV